MAELLSSLNKKLFSSSSNVIILLTGFLLFVGVIIGVFLAQESQDLRQRAAEGAYPICCIDNTGHKEEVNADTCPVGSTQLPENELCINSDESCCYFANTRRFGPGRFNPIAIVCTNGQGDVGLPVLEEYCAVPSSTVCCSVGGGYSRFSEGQCSAAQGQVVAESFCTVAVTIVPTATVTESTNIDQCGSCSCSEAGIGQGNECIRSSNGACVWDPGRCGGGVDPTGTTEPTMTLDPTLSVGPTTIIQNPSPTNTPVIIADGPTLTPVPTPEPTAIFTAVPTATNQPVATATFSSSTFTLNRVGCNQQCSRNDQCENDQICYQTGSSQVCRQVGNLGDTRCGQQQSQSLQQQPNLPAAGTENNTSFALVGAMVIAAVLSIAVLLLLL